MINKQKTAPDGQTDQYDGCGSKFRTPLRSPGPSFYPGKQIPDPLQDYL